MLKQRDVPLFAVKFKGSADAMTALLGGHVPVLIDTVAATRTAARQDQAAGRDHGRADGVDAGRQDRARAGPAQLHVAAWNALMVPHGVPAEIQAEAGRRDAQDPGPAGNRQGAVTTWASSTRPS